MRHFTLFFLLALFSFSSVHAQTVISSQDFNSLDASNSFTDDEVSSGSALTNASSFNSTGTGLEAFQTIWVDTRGIGNGPRDGSESGDFIGVNDFGGGGAPDVGADGTSVGTNKNFQFNDGDGELQLQFSTVDVSGFTNRALSLNYWINDTGYESNDRFRVVISDGVTTVTLLDFGEAGLEGNASADNGSANWNNLSINLDDVIANNSLGNNLTIGIYVDTNSGSENVFVDDIAITGTEGSAGGCQELFLSEYTEGSGLDKCLEIYNPTNSPVDLTTGEYELVFFFNGNTSAGNTISLNGTVPAGGTFVVCDDGAAPPFSTAADQLAGGNFYNGDDAIELLKGGTLIDAFGQKGVDPGSQWGGVTQNNTLIRMASVTSGDNNSTDAFNPSDEWIDVNGISADDLGMHTSDCGGTPPTGPEPGDIIVTEIMNNPSAVSDSDGEYFEVYNTTGSDIDLDGWTISDNGADSHLIDGSVLVPAGGYALLGNNADTGTNGGAPVDYSYGSGWFLSNGGDEVILTDPSGAEIDRVEYDGGPNFPDPNGASMNLDPMALDFTSNDDGSNWCTSTSAYGDGDLGTPGAANDMCGADCTISAVVLTSDGDCSGSDANFRVDFSIAGGSGNYSLVDADDGTVYGSFNPGNPDGSYFLIGTIDGPTSAGTIEVIVSDGEGCTSSPITVNIPDCPPMADCVSPGGLVITEIMQNPSVINDSDGEYFEVYNPTGADADLMSYVIRDNDFDSHTITSSVIVPAGGYVVLARNADDAQNGGLGAAYEYGSDIALANGGDEVILECNGTVIDAVAYDGGPNFPDPNGASMNLDPNALDASSNDSGANWCESTSAYDANNLGTPAMPNDGCSSLPAPYEAEQIGCSSDFDATFDSNSGEFELTSDCAKFGFTQDRGTFVTREACGDFVFDAKLESVSPANAYAGITVRESAAPGAKKFSIIQQPGNGRKNVEYRLSTNAGYQTYWFATWTVGWQYLRIERSGSFFLAYASFTGAPGSYQLVFTQFIPMSSCTRVGMTVAAPAGQEGTLSTAVFSDVSLSSSSFALEAEESSLDEASSLNGSSEFSQARDTGQPKAQIGEFRLFPNPANEELNIRFEQAGAEEATVRILSTDGRSVYENIHGLQGGNLNLSLRQLNMADGMYLLQIATEEEVRTERFMKTSR
jgi:regulation of enolase protein 1 (concanavalin A-like superfamily)